MKMRSKLVLDVDKLRKALEPELRKPNPVISAEFFWDLIANFSTPLPTWMFYIRPVNTKGRLKLLLLALTGWRLWFGRESFEKDFEFYENGKPQKEVVHMNFNDLATEITIKEGKKISLPIGQVKEVLKITFTKLAEMPAGDLASILKKYKK